GIKKALNFHSEPFPTFVYDKGSVSPNKGKPAEHQAALPRLRAPDLMRELRALASKSFGADRQTEQSKTNNAII
ncbi:hypothetical protein, partial [Leptospira levettii]|uniref:hypothetical protein n=1 Tax=Leptospira levettii TaxID=2023178 RepID=UPI001AEF7C1F